jgi:hypothetical protein
LTIFIPSITLFYLFYEEVFKRHVSDKMEENHLDWESLMRKV